MCKRGGKRECKGFIGEGKKRGISTSNGKVPPHPYFKERKRRESKFLRESQLNAFPRKQAQR